MDTKRIAELKTQAANEHRQLKNWSVTTLDGKPCSTVETEVLLELLELAELGLEKKTYPTPGGNPDDKVEALKKNVADIVAEGWDMDKVQKHFHEAAEAHGKPFPGKSQWLEDQAKEAGAGALKPKTTMADIVADFWEEKDAKLQQRMSALRELACRTPGAYVPASDLLAILDLAQWDKTQPPLKGCEHAPIDIPLTSKKPRSPGEALFNIMNPTLKWNAKSFDYYEKWAQQVLAASQPSSELQAIDTALGNVLAFDGCKTRAEKVARAMAMAKKTDDAERQLFKVASQCNRLNEEKNALTERATSAERCRDEFQKRLEPLYGEQPGTIPYALAILKHAMLKDIEYAWGWHCNIAMACHDAGGGSHEACNEGAARFLALLFPGVDTTKHQGYPKPDDEFETWFKGTDIALNARGHNGEPIYEHIAKRAWEASRKAEDKKKSPGLSKDFDNTFPPETLQQ